MVGIRRQSGKDKKQVNSMASQISDASLLENAPQEILDNRDILGEWLDDGLRNAFIEAFSGDYQFIDYTVSPLAEGGNGAVYKLIISIRHKDEIIERQYSLKVMKSRGGVRPAEMERSSFYLHDTYREIYNLHKLEKLKSDSVLNLFMSYPSLEEIVNPDFVLPQEASPFILTELKRESLKDAVVGNNNVEQRKAYVLKFGKIAEVLSQIESGLLMRQQDFKLGNILVGQDDGLALADFGSMVRVGNVEHGADQFLDGFERSIRQLTVSLGPIPMLQVLSIYEPEKVDYSPEYELSSAIYAMQQFAYALIQLYTGKVPLIYPPNKLCIYELHTHENLGGIVPKVMNLGSKNDEDDPYLRQWPYASTAFNDAQLMHPDLTQWAKDTVLLKPAILNEKYIRQNDNPPYIVDYVAIWQDFCAAVGLN